MDSPASDPGDATVRKVTLHLLPFLFLLYIVAYLDRVNFGYAALQMNSSLGIGAELFGFLSGIFFIGYLIFEVPSNIILQKIGARIWIARILISWGIIVIITGFAQDALQLTVLRFLLGIAEAGFFPGVIYYVTRWFPARDLARAVALFMTALTLANIAGAPVSTWILDNIAWLGLEGWRWLFILEGFPAVILGAVTFFILTDSPKDARWLRTEEKAWLISEIARERKEPTGKNPESLMEMLRNPRVWHLAVIYCMLTIGLYGIAFWMPQIIKGMETGATNFEIGLITVIPYGAAAVAMILWSRHSDRTLERRYHTAIPPMLGGIGMIGSALAPNPVIAILMLTLATVGIFCTFGPFWTLPPIFLAGSAAAVGIAVVNSIGNFGGFVGPSAVGLLTQITGDTRAGLAVLGLALLFGGFAVLALKGATMKRTGSDMKKIP
ncbi:MAG: MFS transporter [Methanoregulaceae archaeon]